MNFQVTLYFKVTLDLTIVFGMNPVALFQILLILFNCFVLPNYSNRFSWCQLFYFCLIWKYVFQWVLITSIFLTASHDLPEMLERASYERLKITHTKERLVYMIPVFNLNVNCFWNCLLKHNWQLSIFVNIS